MPQQGVALVGCEEAFAHAPGRRASEPYGACRVELAPSEVALSEVALSEVALSEVALSEVALSPNVALVKRWVTCAPAAVRITVVDASSSPSG